MKKVLILGNGHIAHKFRKLVTELGCDVVSEPCQNMHAAFIVHDEENINIKYSLSVRREFEQVPIYAIINQESLGEKITANISNFKYVNPARIAATKFVQAALEDLVIDERPSKIKLSKKVFTPDTLAKKAIVFIVGVILSSTCFFHVYQGLPWVDAFYFTVTMWSTVGFGDFSLRDQPDYIKIVGSLIMVLSVTATAIMFALISDTVVRKRRELSRGKISYGGRGHVIVIGGGSVGSQVVSQLIELGEQPVMIDKSMDGLHILNVLQTGIPFLVGDAQNERHLIRAGLSKCKALICVTQNDLTNLEVGLEAITLRNGLRVVLRIYDEGLANDLKLLGIERSISMSAIAAKKLLELMEEQNKREINN